MSLFSELRATLSDSNFAPCVNALKATRSNESFPVLRFLPEIRDSHEVIFTLYALSIFPPAVGKFFLCSNSILDD